MKVYYDAIQRAHFRLQPYRNCGAPAVARGDSTYPPTLQRDTRALQREVHDRGISVLQVLDRKSTRIPLSRIVWQRLLGLFQIMRGRLPGRKWSRKRVQESKGSKLQIQSTPHSDERARCDSSQVKAIAFVQMASNNAIGSRSHLRRSERPRRSRCWSGKRALRVTAFVQYLIAIRSACYFKHTASCDPVSRQAAARSASLSRHIRQDHQDVHRPSESLSSAASSPFLVHLPLLVLG